MRWLVASLSLTALACSSNTTTAVSGGDSRVPPAPSVTPANYINGCGQPDGGPPEGDGITFTSLYNDYFGPSGAAACRGTGACHGDPSQPGFMASGGYQCPDPGDAGAAAAKQTCYNAMVNVSKIAVPNDPTGGELLSIIRKQSGGGRMPRTPCTYSFSQKGVKRITDWINSGAQNN
jgi:hypothetical protein